MGHGRKKGPGRVPIAMHAQMGESERAEQPCPDRALVISAVARDRTAFISALIARLGRTEAPQAERGQEVPAARLHDLALVGEGKRTRGQRHGEDLIGSKRGLVTVGSIQDIEAVARRLVPEAGE